MSIELFESNSFETLWEQFEKQLSVRQSRPLATELIVVPASGWESYFSRQLTTIRRCWAQFQFATLGQWINQTLDQWLPDDTTASREADTYSWAIANKLPHLIDDDDFQAVRGYMRADGDALETRRLIDLSRKIGSLFDQYTLYRPELLEAWRAGRDWVSDGESPKHARWQRKLWQSLGGFAAMRSVSEYIDQLVSALRSGSRQLPERVNVWICSGLVPAHVKFINAMGEVTQIYLHVLSPRYSCWGTQAQQKERICKWVDSGESMRSFCKESGDNELHPLLNSLGQLSRHRTRLVEMQQDSTWRPIVLREISTLPDEATLLSTLQRDLIAGGVPRPGVLPLDNSLGIHNCHSSTREVEVLHNEIRESLENDQQLRPEDIVVLCPDLEAYAPIINAVFGLTRPGQDGHIPYNIAGRSPRRTRPLFDAFFRVLDVLQGRFGAAEVLDLLNDELIASTVDLSPDDVSDIFGWIADSGVRWGINASHRISEALPGTDLNTWQFGLDRLLMGYAMPPGGGQLVGSIVALDRVHGLDGEKLGKGWEFIHDLRKWREEVANPRPIGDWRKPLYDMAEMFLDTAQDEVGAQQIRVAIDRLVSVVEQNGFDQPLAFAIVCSELAHEAEQLTGGARFQLGGMTVCELAARRSIPSRFVALLGMNDGAFPRVDRHVGFDLLTAEPQLGDRSLRLEDKHLFLEAIMSARHRLVITYQGQNVRDHRSRPPSVLVEELLDAIERSCDGTNQSELIREQIIVRHPLQAFSPRYFDAHDRRLFCYDKNQQRAAQSIWDGPGATPTFVSTPLSASSDTDEISVSELRRLIDRPWEIFLGQLGLYLGESSEADGDREPLLLNALEKWSLGNRWLSGQLIGEEEYGLVQRLTREGQLPAGALGLRILSKLRREADDVATKAIDQGVDATALPVAVRILVGNTTIAGRIDGLTPQGLRGASYSKIKAGQIMRLWLDHLLVTASKGRSIGSAVWIGRPESGGDRIELAPISPEDAMTELEKFVHWYRLSLSYPLPIFPDAVASIVTAMFKGDDINDEQSARRMLSDAESQYLEQQFGKPAAELFSVRTAFSGRDPMAMACAEMPELESDNALTLLHAFVSSICQPMVDHLECFGKPRAAP